MPKILKSACGWTPALHLRDAKPPLFVRRQMGVKNGLLPPKLHCFSAPVKQARNHADHLLAAAGFIPAGFPHAFLRIADDKAVIGMPDKAKFIHVVGKHGDARRAERAFKISAALAKVAAAL